MEEKLRAVNELLRKTGVKLSIEQRKDSFCLRGTFPARDGQGKKQSRLPLKLRANRFNLAAARDEAIRVWNLLERGEFRWKDFTGEAELTAPQIVERFGKHLLAGGCTEANWADIRKTGLHLLPDAPLTMEMLVEVLEKTRPNSRSRQLRAQNFIRLAQFAGIEAVDELVNRKGKYSNPEIRHIPSDEEIETALDDIKSVSWRSLAWRLAIWGLRAHEAYYCEIMDTTPFELTVLDGKTGRRGPVLPLHLKWAEEKPWRGELPDLNKRETDPNRVFGDRVSKGFRRHGLPFTPHSLRHAWAIRASTVYRLPLTVSARMMGHSVEVHTKQYHRWLSADETRRAWEAANRARETSTQQSLQSVVGVDTIALHEDTKANVEGVQSPSDKMGL